MNTQAIKPIKLNVRERKFIANKVAGKTNAQAYIDAGYKASTRDIADGNSSKLLAKEKIQVAIERALESHNLTPELAIGELKKIVEQDKELGAKRLAIKDTLELHGWQRGDRPTISLEIGNAFFNQTRNTDHQNSQ